MLTNEKPDVEDTEVYEMLISIYFELLTSQHDLGDSAKSVLYQNLWDLYQC